MSEPREIRDPVFGFIRIDGIEGDIVSSPIFQRLRRIRQLAFAHLVYPGALHTRFEHSLGVCHIASLIANSLGVLNDEIKLIRLAALLHDIGHGPFSHVSEEALEIYTDKEKLPSDLNKTEKIHEHITADIIGNDPYIRRHIASVERDKIIKILGEGYGDPLLRSIVSGPIDADKQDYLLRDSYFCGVKYGVFDRRQLHREMRAVDDPPEGKHLMISKDGIHALEQFVLAKYYITNQVYRHRVRLITDQMLIRAICLGIDIDQIEELYNLYRYDGSPEFIKDYVLWDDAKFLMTFLDRNFEGKYCHEFLVRLNERRLLKRIFDRPIKDLPEICRDDLLNISRPENKEQRTRLERYLWQPICKTIKGKNLGKITCNPEDDSHFLIIYSYTIKSVRAQSRNDEAAILVDRGPKGISTFEEESALFNSINERLSEAFVELYAPVSYDTPVDRDKIKTTLDKIILENIVSFFEGGER
ncbi:MAG: HD domain-containing protein [Deltaproteobacteria bacterium]|nr:HD domain-containing protein [Deltaproteobacteria bacterium]